MNNLENVRRIGDWHTQTIAHGLNKPLLVRETVVSAINKGLKQICFTDHYPLPPEFNDPTIERDCSMPKALYDGQYLVDVASVQREYKKDIQVYYGAEFDWLPDYAERTRKQTQMRPYDYLIGSVHFLRDKTGTYWILDYNKEMFMQAVGAFGGIKNLVRSYYAEIRSMVNSNLFNGVGHLDLVKKYSDISNPLFEEDAAWYIDEVLITLDEIAQSGMTMEINTAGFQKNCKSTYPSPWILRESKQKGIELTIGSDGHDPEEIGRDLEKAIELAKNVGYTAIQTYQNRKKLSVLLT